MVVGLKLVFIYAETAVPKSNLSYYVTAHKRFDPSQAENDPESFRPTTDKSLFQKWVKKRRKKFSSVRSLAEISHANQLNIFSPFGSKVAKRKKLRNHEFVRSKRFQNNPVVNFPKSEQSFKMVKFPHAKIVVEDDTNKKKNLSLLYSNGDSFTPSPLQDSHQLFASEFSQHQNSQFSPQDSDFHHSQFSSEVSQHQHPQLLPEVPLHHHSQLFPEIKQHHNSKFLPDVSQYHNNQVSSESQHHQSQFLSEVSPHQHSEFPLKVSQPAYPQVLREFPYHSHPQISPESSVHQHSLSGGRYENPPIDETLSPVASSTDQDIFFSNDIKDSPTNQKKQISNHVSLFPAFKFPGQNEVPNNFSINFGNLTEKPKVFLVFDKGQRKEASQPDIFQYSKNEILNQPNSFSLGTQNSQNNFNMGSSSNDGFVTPNSRESSFQIAPANNFNTEEEHHQHKDFVTEIINNFYSQEPIQVQNSLIPEPVDAIYPDTKNVHQNTLWTGPSIAFDSPITTNEHSNHQKNFRSHPINFLDLPPGNQPTENRIKELSADNFQSNLSADQEHRKFIGNQQHGFREKNQQLQYPPETRQQANASDNPSHNLLIHHHPDFSTGNQQQELPAIRRQQELLTANQPQNVGAHNQRHDFDTWHLQQEFLTVNQPQNVGAHNQRHDFTTRNLQKEGSTEVQHQDMSNGNRQQNDFQNNNTPTHDSVLQNPHFNNLRENLNNFYLTEKIPQQKNYSNFNLPPESSHSVTINFIDSLKDRSQQENVLSNTANSIDLSLKMQSEITSEQNKVNDLDARELPGISNQNSNIKASSEQRDFITSNQQPIFDNNFQNFDDFTGRSTTPEPSIKQPLSSNFKIIKLNSIPINSEIFNEPDTQIKPTIEEECLTKGLNNCMHSDADQNESQELPSFINDIIENSGSELSNLLNGNLIRKSIGKVRPPEVHTVNQPNVDPQLINEFQHLHTNTERIPLFQSESRVQILPSITDKEISTSLNTISLTPPRTLKSDTETPGFARPSLSFFGNTQDISPDEKKSDTISIPLSLSLTNKEMPMLKQEPRLPPLVQLTPFEPRPPRPTPPQVPKRNPLYFPQEFIWSGSLQELGYTTQRPIAAPETSILPPFQSGRESGHLNANDKNFFMNKFLNRKPPRSFLSNHPTPPPSYFPLLPRYQSVAHQESRPDAVAAPFLTSAASASEISSHFQVFSAPTTPLPRVVSVSFDPKQSARNAPMVIFTPPRPVFPPPPPFIDNKSLNQDPGPLISEVSHQGFPPTASKNHQQNIDKTKEEQPKRYEYRYVVTDPAKGIQYGHAESREGSRAKGEYFVTLSDKRTQHVTYVLDENGYRADVKYYENSLPVTE